MKNVFKTLLKVGAHTLVAGLKIGGGEVGDLAADIISRKLGIGKNNPKFGELIEKLSHTKEGRARILAANHEFELESQRLLNESEFANLQHEANNYAQSQESYRAELEYGKVTKDTFVPYTRPLIIRELFKVAKFMVYTLVFAFVMDLVTDSILIKNCYDELFNNECVTFIHEREPYSVKISNLYKANWVWLSPLFGIFMTWFGGRSYEKANGGTTTKTSDEL